MDLIEQLVAQNGIWLAVESGAYPGLDLVLRDWEAYYLSLPGATVLRVGPRLIPPIKPGSDVFLLKFENQLGLAEIQAMQAGRPVGPALKVEVISRKFPTLAAHKSFFQPLLDDLFARAARIPFTFSATTQQSTLEARRPPTPLFVLHFLCNRENRKRLAMARSW